MIDQFIAFLVEGLNEGAVNAQLHEAVSKS